MSYSFNQAYLKFKSILMLTGQVILTIDGQHMVYVSIPIPISSRGVPRNSLLYLVQAKDPKIIVVSLLFSLTHRDNISAVSLASNPVFHARTKHIEANYHYIHGQVVRKQINVRYVSTKKRVANIFTRGLKLARCHKR